MFMSIIDARKYPAWSNQEQLNRMYHVRQNCAPRRKLVYVVTLRSLLMVQRSESLATSAILSIRRKCRNTLFTSTNRATTAPATQCFVRTAYKKVHITCEIRISKECKVNYLIKEYRNMTITPRCHNRLPQNTKHICVQNVYGDVNVPNLTKTKGSQSCSSITNEVHEHMVCQG